MSFWWGGGLSTGLAGLALSQVVGRNSIYTNRL